MSTGTVKMFNGERGYGFIGHDDGGPDIFAHAKNLIGVKTLAPGDRVEFDVVNGEKGLAAQNVRPL